MDKFADKQNLTYIGFNTKTFNFCATIYSNIQIYAPLGGVILDCHINEHCQTYKTWKWFSNQKQPIRPKIKIPQNIDMLHIKMASLKCWLWISEPYNVSQGLKLAY